MLKRLIRKVFFNKKRKPNYYNRIGNQKYVSWHTYNRDMDNMQHTLHNIMAKMKLRKIANTSLVGDEKDAERFEEQW
jgi:hypothetical protein